MGNDLSSEPTRRYLVLADTVLIRDEQSSESKGWFKKFLYSREVWVPDMGALSKLWRWSSSQGVRLELVFIDEMVGDATQIWDMLDKGSANPFSDWVPYENLQIMARDLSYRPDILGVVCHAGTSAVFGGKGFTMEWIP
jgi:hypothetical protein